MIKKKGNSKLIRVDSEIFGVELQKFKQKNKLKFDPETTREIGKLMRELRLNELKFDLKDRIKF